eukprot:1975-Heterococcus_DN1.PRE.1
MAGLCMALESKSRCTAATARLESGRAKRLLSIFCDYENEDDVQILKWTKVPPVIQQRGTKRKVSATQLLRQHADISAPVLSILTEILVKIGDTTSVLTHESTAEDMYRYRVHRQGIKTVCAKAQEHRGNSSILQLTTVYGRPVVKYICFSDRCGAGRAPVVLRYPELARKWANAESSRKTANITADAFEIGHDMCEETAPECSVGDVPHMPAEEEEEPAWYAGHIPDMPAEEEEEPA